MKSLSKPSLGRTLIEGVLVGALATQTLDWVSTALYYRGESESERLREDETRSGLPVYEAAVDQISRKAGVPLQKKDLEVWGWRFHKTFGWFGGVQYMIARRSNRRIGAGFGLGFGALFFLIVDEVLMPLMKWSPGPRAFSWKVHARGAVSHLAYGVTAETVARGLDKLSDRKAA